ncbi:MAG: hypothetical protein IKS80_03920 [Bacteroidaceae bacterium]|nr:hypothetical protein [Bacteroidaceae bacterium]
MAPSFYNGGRGGTYTGKRLLNGGWETLFETLFRKKGIKKKIAEKFGYLRGKEYLCKPIIISLWIKG